MRQSVNKNVRSIEDARKFAQKLISPRNRVTTGLDAADDIVIDLTSKGLVLKDSNGVYWRVTINTAGALISTALAGKP